MNTVKRDSDSSISLSASDSFTSTASTDNGMYKILLNVIFLDVVWDHLGQYWDVSPPVSVIRQKNLKPSISIKIENPQWYNNMKFQGSNINLPCFLVKCPTLIRS